MTIIAKKVLISNKGVPQQELRNNESVNVRLSGDPVVRVNPDSAAIINHPDIIEKSSDYLKDITQK